MLELGLEQASRTSDPQAGPGPMKVLIQPSSLVSMFQIRMILWTVMESKDLKKELVCFSTRG